MGSTEDPRKGFVVDLIAGAIAPPGQKVQLLLSGSKLQQPTAADRSGRACCRMLLLNTWGRTPPAQWLPSLMMHQHTSCRCGVVPNNAGHGMGNLG